MLAYLLVSGLTTGSLYALMAIGLVVVYKATRVVNFAHGELFMLGGFFAYTLHVLAHVPYVLALVAAIGGTLVLGLVTERLAYRPLIRPLITIWRCKRCSKMRQHRRYWARAPSPLATKRGIRSGTAPLLRKACRVRR